MGWLSSLFSSDSSQNSRKGQAMSSTHEAFSLPTSSPIFSAHPDAFNPDALNTPEPDSAMSPSYTYPPQGSGSYGYIPTSAGSRQASLLPTHHDPLHTPSSPSTPYPPLSNTWNRLRAWLTREYPELGDTLNYGILPQDLAQIEMQFGFALPAVVRESYLAVDGQEAESAAGCSEGLFFGLTLLPLEDVLEEWKFWREVDDDPTTGANPRLRDIMQSIPPGWVRKEYSQRGWIPLIVDKGGNYIGIDLNPSEGGSVGQVIVFGRDFDTKVVLWKGDGPAGWARWLASFVEELESGEGYEIGAGNEVSEGSEDDLGYESYFYDGNGRGQGDGGGDIGSGGGLHLTGEYRGWSVLEAWADRSVRKWYEHGVIPDPSMLAEEKSKGKAAESDGFDVLDLAQRSGAEVPIPVLADVDEPIPAPVLPPSGSVANTGSRPPPLNLPTVTVTKPPAPLPVELPTPRDIVALPSPPESANSSFDEDLESGRSSGMREISHEQETGLVSSRRTPKPQLQPLALHENADASGSALAATIPLPTSPVDRPSSGLSGRLSPPPDIPDLLADSAPVMDTTPIEPSSPARDDILIEPILEQPAAVTSEEASEPLADHIDDVEDAVDQDVTVRLVGGGGTAGIVDVITPPPDEEPRTSTSPEPEVPDIASIHSITSVTSQDSVAKKGSEKKHKKTKSGLAGLKKLGHLSGLRKKDSSSSVKDTAK